MSEFWTITGGDSPLVATAIHHGHAARPDVLPLFALDDAGRLREEDPFTGGWTTITGSRVVVHHSRFEVDLNRPPERAVYVTPDDAWGLTVWHDPLPDNVLARSRQQHTDFYAAMREFFDRVQREHGVFVVYDLHTYNHRRNGPDAPPADAAGNPEINVGTGHMPDAIRQAGIVDAFMRDAAAYHYMGRHLDVRENVKFRGGYFAKWLHETYPETACVLSIEFKKFFMDEWTGQPDPEQLAAIKSLLAATVPGVLAARAALIDNQR